MSRPTLPGTIPGLLRVGSPVIHWNGNRERGDSRKATIIHTWEDDGQTKFIDARMDPCDEEDWFCRSVDSSGAIPRQLDLDLTNATGRAHAAWWLAAQYGKTFIKCRAIWYPGMRRHSDDWTLTDGNCSLRYSTDSGRATSADELVPSLAGLSSFDPRRLPDGSRWVNAEALRLACLHVAGVTR